VNKLKAGGVTSIYVSSKRTEIKLKGQLSISLSKNQPTDKDSSMTCGWWNESSKTVMSADCTVTDDSKADVLTCTCSHLTDFMSLFTKDEVLVEGEATTPYAYGESTTLNQTIAENTVEENILNK